MSGDVHVQFCERLGVRFPGRLSLKEVEEAIEQSLRDILGGDQEVGGPKVVADLLNLTGSSVEKNVLDAMDAQVPEVAEAVRNLMFVFNDLGKLTDRELQVLLREVIEKAISTLVLLIGYLWIFWDPKKGGWHDHIGGTYVVKRNRS